MISLIQVKTSLGSLARTSRQRSPLSGSLNETRPRFFFSGCRQIKQRCLHSANLLPLPSRNELCKWLKCDGFCCVLVCCSCWAPHSWRLDFGHGQKRQVYVVYKDASDSSFRYPGGYPSNSPSTQIAARTMALFDSTNYPQFPLSSHWGCQLKQEILYLMCVSVGLHILFCLKWG